MLRLFKPPRWIERILPRYTWRFSVSDNTIFITFDDGPAPSITPMVLDLLEKYDWKATFFCVGENIRKYPEIKAEIIGKGHRIGNHTQFHDNAFRTGKRAYIRSMKSFEAYHETNIFRPPYGRIKKSLAKQILKTHKIILWSWLSYDYDESVSDELILKKLEKVKPGDILVFHDNERFAERVKVLFPKVFAELKLKGFESKAI